MTGLSMHLSTKHKLLAVMTMDWLLLPLSVWLAFALRFSQWWPPEMQQFGWLFIISPLLAIPIFTRWGLYRAILNYISIKAFFAIVKAVSLHVLVFMGFTMIVDIPGIPVTVFVIYWLVTLTLVGGSRALLRTYLQWLRGNSHSRTKVIIYGAGSAGAELVEALQAGIEFLPIAFIDEKRELQGTEIRGLKVYPAHLIESVLEKYGVKQVLLAIPSAQRARRQEIINLLEPLRVHVKTVPALMDIVSGRSKVEDLREVGILDILGRKRVPPDERLLAACITDKSVMVTGAGGSIGSELCRQIINLHPHRLILFEASEFALYTIERELREFCVSNGGALSKIQIVPVLGNITNEHKVQLVLETFEVQTLYHAAAYKHVPLVEFNPIEGVKNNIFGTWRTAKAAVTANVETFILISTDKAVRPTNVMGATKRVAELVIQGLAHRSEHTRFSIVRFGNVLGSSGSVVPLFRQQIRRGGPITLTHPDMTRYFMTIREAAQLVIQAGSMGNGGVVFVLDMGEPVLIRDLAKRMVSLSGLTVRDAENPNGDISIVTTQLRPGEKIYEELLLGNNVTITQHPRIMRAQEFELPWTDVEQILTQLERACNSDDSAELIKLLQDAVDGYTPQCGIEDPLWLAAHHMQEKLSQGKTKKFVVYN